MDQVYYQQNLSQISTKIEVIKDGIWAGALGAFFSGIPSTLWALWSGSNLMEAIWAAGRLFSANTPPGWKLFGFAMIVHISISTLWTIVLTGVLPRSWTWLWGIAAGVIIAVIDLQLIGSRFSVIMQLAYYPQLADHMAFGGIVGGVLQWRRWRRQIAFRMQQP